MLNKKIILQKIGAPIPWYNQTIFFWNLSHQNLRCRLQLKLSHVDEISLKTPDKNHKIY